MAHEQPHDKLIKETLSFLPEAVRFFKFFLPANISAKLDYSTLRLENTTFVNEQEREFYSDLIFSCQRTNSGSVFLQFLIEHKSVPERRPHLQVGAYLSEGYRYQHKQQLIEKKKVPLTPIIPILFYHGTEKWTEQEFSDYFSLPDTDLNAYLPAFKLILINLSAFTDRQILTLGVTFLTSTLLVFKHKIVKEYVLTNTTEVFIFVNTKSNPEDVSRFYRAFLVYLFRAFRFGKPEMEQIVNVLPKITKPMFESTYDMLIKEGEIKGEIKGEAIGIQKGEAIGERKRSFEVFLETILLLPTLNIAVAAQIYKLPEPFILAFRKQFDKGNLRAAKKVAVGFFMDLPGLSEADVKAIKEMVRKAHIRRRGGNNQHN